MSNDKLEEGVDTPPIENPVSRKLTFGEKSVGLNFNPSNDDAVGRIKRSCADAIDVLNNERIAIKTSQNEDDGQNGERLAMLTLAIRAIQDGQMWGVKAVTWKD
jgi:hypothetical protein